MIKVKLTEKEFRLLLMSIEDKWRAATTKEDIAFWAELINKVTKQYEVQKGEK